MSLLALLPLVGVFQRRSGAFESCLSVTFTVGCLPHSGSISTLPYLALRKSLSRLQLVLPLVLSSFAVAASGDWLLHPPRALHV